MKDDIGSTGQNHIWTDVAQQMTGEMLCCDIDEFLCHYAPFCPTDNSINSALEKLKHEKLLQGYKWRKLGSGKISSKKGKRETKVFQRLKFIVEALTGQECFGTGSKTSRKCNFNYHDRGDTQMVGENAGSTFWIDAYFSPASSPPLFESEKVVVSQVAVAAEFKNKEKDFHHVCTQILNIDIFWYGDSELPEVGQYGQSHHEWWSA